MTPLDRLRHDLGKYVALQTRSLGPDPTEDQLRGALEADLLRTRSGPDGVFDAIQVWEAARVDALRGDALYDRVEQGVDRLRGPIAALRSGSPVDLRAAAADALHLSDAVYALHRARRGA